MQMRCPIESREWKYIQGYGSLSFAKTLGDRYGKKFMKTATKTVKNVRMVAAKTASKRAVQKTAETTGDLIGNKITNKFTSAGKSKSKKKRTKQWDIQNTWNLHATEKISTNYKRFKIKHKIPKNHNSIRQHNQYSTKI